MFRYVQGLIRAIFGREIWLRAAQVLVASYLGLGIFADYAGLRDKINAKLGFTLMPSTFPWNLLLLAFAGWLILRLAHKEAMRYWRAARIHFDKSQVHAPWILTTQFVGGAKTDVMSSVTVDVRNIPYKTDSGDDVEKAWAKIELFDLNSKPIQMWEFARWEDNKLPPQTQHQFIRDENYRTLSANRSPNRITIATKRLLEGEAYRLRGEDQQNFWYDKNNPILPGEYFVRLTIEGNGLQEPAEYVFMLKNPGRNKSLEVQDAIQSIQKYWP